MLRLIRTAFLLFALWPLSVLAAPAALEAATLRYETGDYPAAYRAFYGLAQAGDPQAQYYVGLMRLMGQGTDTDAPAGIGWLEKSAGQGYTDAAVTLGNIYASGLGVQMDAERAMEWLDLAAVLAVDEDQETDCD